ncbi:MAG: SLAP domain-containing protein [Lactobacillus sp.]|nr:SLAP domain-containing protein [Lactobacillus sp.]
MYKKTGHLTGVYDPAKGSTNGTEDNSGISKPSDNATGNNGSGSVADNPTSTNVTSPRTVKLRKASYRYTSKGKRVSKKLLKKGSYVKINGKTYYIKGKTYYRIAKNRYIRKANVAK